MNVFQLPASTHIGQVQLQTSNLSKLLSFYSDLLGFREIKREGNISYLSAGKHAPASIVLIENKNAIPRNRKSPGLFHTAFLLPDRHALAQLLLRLYTNNIRMGFGDHGVSEALYLSDPDGNGVELYADRPRDQWPIINGNIEMYTHPVDTDSLLAELKNQPNTWNGIHPDTIIGHIHLQVSDINKAGRFYHDLLGFNITQSNYSGALFVAAGNYHHHVGLNTWYSKDMSPAPENTTGLLSYAIHVPSQETIQILKDRLENNGLSVKSSINDLAVKDFDEIQVHIQVANNSNYSAWQV